MRSWFLGPSCIGPIQIHAGYLHGQSHRPRCAGAVQNRDADTGQSAALQPLWQSAGLPRQPICTLHPSCLTPAPHHPLSPCTWEVCKLTRKPTDPDAQHLWVTELLAVSVRQAQKMKAARRPRSPMQLEAYACCVHISRHPVARTMNASMNLVIKFMSLTERTACKRQLKIFFVTLCSHFLFWTTVSALVCSVWKCVRTCFCVDM